MVLAVRIGGFPEDFSYDTIYQVSDRRRILDARSRALTLGHQHFTLNFFRPASPITTCSGDISVYAQVPPNSVYKYQCSPKEAGMYAVQS